MFTTVPVGPYRLSPGRRFFIFASLADFLSCFYKKNKPLMIIVHDIFVCKPGNASKLAKKFKEAMVGNKELQCIMTDMSGQYNRVIMVSQYESLTAWEKSWDQWKNPTEEMKKMDEAMAGYQEMYRTGSRELYQVA